MVFSLVSFRHLWNLPRLLFPPKRTRSGILIAVVGAGTCFRTQAVSYAVVIASLLLTKIEQDAAANHG